MFLNFGASLPEKRRRNLLREHFKRFKILNLKIDHEVFLERHYPGHWLRIGLEPISEDPPWAAVSVLMLASMAG